LPSAVIAEAVYTYYVCKVNINMDEVINDDVTMIVKICFSILGNLMVFVCIRY
jgi:hypothetical protein